MGQFSCRIYLKKGHLSIQTENRQLYTILENNWRNSWLCKAFSCFVILIHQKWGLVTGKMCKAGFANRCVKMKSNIIWTVSKKFIFGLLMSVHFHHCISFTWPSKKQQYLIYFFDNGYIVFALRKLWSMVIILHVKTQNTTQRKFGKTIIVLQII